MANVTYVKFMKREELVKMLTEIHRFTTKDKNGKNLIIDNRIDKPTYRNLTGFNGEKITICDHVPAFKLNAFDIDDCIISGEGYVRFSSFLYIKDRVDTPQGKILVERYGFQREE